jgi:hypothetical protein
MESSLDDEERARSSSRLQVVDVDGLEVGGNFALLFEGHRATGSACVRIW